MAGGTELGAAVVEITWVERRVILGVWKTLYINSTLILKNIYIWRASRARRACLKRIDIHGILSAQREVLQCTSAPHPPKSMSRTRPGKCTGDGSFAIIEVLLIAANFGCVCVCVWLCLT